jgi:hypothetical protein
MTGPPPPTCADYRAEDSYLLKLILAIATTPLIYLGHAILERTFLLHGEPGS